MVKEKERIICCVIAVILFFMGMCVETSTIESSFSDASNATTSTIRSASFIADEEESCTTDMLGKGTSTLRLNVGNYAGKGQSKAVFIFLIVGAILQYLLYYQRAEGRDENQFVLCRSVAVDYIHQKDGGK